MCTLKEQSDFLAQKKREVAKMDLDNVERHISIIRSTMRDLSEIGQGGCSSYRWLEKTLNVYISAKVAIVINGEKIPQE